jgi:CMP-N-acetylneuraminic acid synthetase
MKVVALMIGRGGSSLADKNILPVMGIPLLHWTAAAARASRYIDRFYVSSDCPRILATAGHAGYQPIERPPHLATATAQSSDAVRHAFDIMERDGPIDVLVVQHANVGTVSSAQIDACIDLLLADDAASSVVPAHQYPEYHPMRAKRVTSDGSLRPFVEADGISGNRQDLPACFFFDHSFWVLRGRAAVFDPAGQQPWPCMGSHILPFETQGCRDVHDLADLAATERWLIDNRIPKPDFTPRPSSSS